MLHHITFLLIFPLKSHSQGRSRWLLLCKRLKAVDIHVNGGKVIFSVKLSDVPTLNGLSPEAVAEQEHASCPVFAVSRVLPGSQEAAPLCFCSAAKLRLTLKPLL